MERIEWETIREKNAKATQRFHTVPTRVAGNALWRRQPDGPIGPEDGIPCAVTTDSFCRLTSTGFS